MKATFLCGGKSYYDAIPLTEEWVLSFGFIPSTAPWNGDELKFDDYHLGPIGLYEVTGTPNMWQVAYHDKMLQIFLYSVHELQNLFFTFTGEELKRK